MREKILITDEKELRGVLGPFDQNIRYIEEATGVVISSRGNEIVLEGEDTKIAQARRMIKKLLQLVKKGEVPDAGQVKYIVDSTLSGVIEEEDVDFIEIGYRGKIVKAKTAGQAAYIKSMRENEIVFAIGPAGTGKTYLAVAWALHLLFKGIFHRVILTRPAVEAGESLGYLPGTMVEKVDPYLRPLYDSLFDLLGPEKYHKFMQQGIIEVAPLAYMRGRTLNDAFIILDEAQNTTIDQMKMFLTRMGSHARIVVTGDITQIDLPPSKESGLVHAIKILEGINGIGFVFLTEKDVVRHPLVQKIVLAYQKFEEGKQR